MEIWLWLASCVDRINTRIGQFIYWLTLVMVLVGGYNAIVRYMGRFTGTNLSSNVYIEAQWYLYSLVFLLGAAYALKENAHVRVDVLYSRLSDRGRAWIDVLGTVLFLIPFCLLMVYVTSSYAANSWKVLEISPDPGGLPRYPIKSIIPLAFVLLYFQGFSQLIKSLAVVLKTTDQADSSLISISEEA
jgi:TRAP-type mannitol/chloroaromatic compound transport system permease small subunit